MTKQEIIRLLEKEDGEEIASLFARAREVRKANQGNKIFAYGFVYFTTYCRNNCNFVINLSAREKRFAFLHIKSVRRCAIRIPHMLQLVCYFFIILIQ